MTRSSLTEETANTPGWVDTRLEEAFAGLTLNEAAATARDAYASCLGECRGAVDVDAGHDRCRAALLTALRAADVDVGELEHRLMALEAEISSDT